MRRTLLAFFGLSFVIYWLWTAELPLEQPETLSPVIPSLVRVTASLPGKLQLFVRKHLSNESDMRTWLKSESARISRVDPDPSATARRLEERGARLSPLELAWLRNTALDIRAGGDERFLAVYMIGLAQAPEALDLLKEIGHSAIGPVHSDRAYSDELVIRAHALESVIHRLPPSESVRYLREVLMKTPDPGIARHAQYWLSHLG